MFLLSRLLRRSFCTATANATSNATTVTAKTTERGAGYLSSDIYREKDLKRLVEKFKAASDNERFRTKNRIYKDAVVRLAHAKRFKWVEEILEHQKQYPDISKEGFACRLISLYGRSGMFDNAQKVFDEMPERNCGQTVLSFNSLLGACVKSNKYDMSVELFENLPGKLGVEPDVFSYNMLIKAFCEMGSYDSARNVVDEMEKKGINPDLITFNTLLSWLFLKGQFTEGEKIWNLMMSKNVVPDIRTYNARLRGLVVEKKTKEAVEFVEEMKSKAIKPDLYTFNSLINGFVNERNLEEAMRWYDEMDKSRDEMEKRRWAPADRDTLVILVPFVCEKGDLEFAVKLCKDIFSKRCLVNKQLLQGVVDALAKESRIEEAKELVKLGTNNKYCHYRLKLPSQD